MSNVVSFHPPKSGRITFYEVTDREGHAEWGGESAPEAVRFFSQDILNKRLIVSEWFADEEDARPAGESVDITGLVMCAIAEGRGRI